MACDCDTHIDCGDTIEIDVKDDSGGSVGHTQTYSFKREVTNLPVIDFLEKTERKFSISCSNSGSTSKPPSYVVSCSTGVISCGNAEGKPATYSGRCTESCVKEINTPYYLDRKNDIFVYKYAKQSLKFDVGSTGSGAGFKGKWGINYYAKFCIPKGTYVEGIEQFFLVKDGTKTELAKTTYSFDPFEIFDLGGGIWGPYGDRMDTTGTTPDTPNVRQVLCYPNPPSLGIPLDNDVKHYNFYDYNAKEEGFLETGLGRDDGGKDYFYPYWCRSMFEDKLWRATADERWDAYTHSTTVDNSGTYQWSIDEPVTYGYPFGSFAVDSQEAFVYSLVCQFSDRANSGGAVINDSSFTDLYKAIYTNNKLNGEPFDVCYPVTPI